MALDPQMPGYRLPQTTLEKLIVLIDQLKYKRRKSYKQLANILEKSERQIRRDVQMLERFYALDYDEYGRPFILAEVNEDELMVSLTAEEMDFLGKLVNGSKNTLREGLLKKLDRMQRLDLSDRPSIAEVIDTLEEGINRKERVMLKGYVSAGNDQPRDILVEPISITELKYLTAFDVKGGITKIYSLDRMQDAELLFEDFECEEQHRHLKPDPFGVVTGKAYDAELLLTNRAYLLMREEYPRTLEFLHASENEKYPWRFKGWVFGLQGVGRFVLGLIDEIKVMSPEELNRFIEEKVRRINS